MTHLLVRSATCIALLALAMVVGIRRASAADEHRALHFAGGHELTKDDFGRPINLIAAGIGVKPAQFYEAFSGVTPAKGRPPTGAEARRNKEAMMKVLAPLGVSNERLDEVANYYRFRPQNGEMWPTKPATGYAVVAGGKVTKLVITAGGSGYNTAPTVTIEGLPDVKLKAVVSYSKDLKKNGAIEKVARVSDEAKPGAQH